MVFARLNTSHCCLFSYPFESKDRRKEVLQRLQQLDFPSVNRNTHCWFGSRLYTCLQSIILNGGQKKEFSSAVLQSLIYVQMCSENSFFHCAESFELIVQQIITDELANNMKEKFSIYNSVESYDDDRYDTSFYRLNDFTVDFCSVYEWNGSA